MQKNNQNPFDLLKRAVRLPDGMTGADWHRFRVLFARKGRAPRIHASLENSIAFRELKDALNQIPFKKPRPMQGDIILGKNSGGITRYHSKYAPSHLLSIGATGVGKTVMLVFLLLQYLFIASGIWVFDFIKRELRGLKRLAQRASASFHVCRYELMRINLLDPQGTDPVLFANVSAEFLTLMLGMPPVATLILKICITQLYEQCGLLTNPDAPPPILSELIVKVRSFQGNKAAKEAILIRLQALLANQRQIFNVRKGLPVRELAQRFIIWELDGAETQCQNLIVAYLISMLFLQRVQSRDNKLTIIALDEGSRLYSKKIEATYSGPSYISTMTCTIRKMLIALLVFTQSMHDLSNSIIANSGIKVLFRVGTAQDYDSFGRSMGLTSEQIRFCKTNLPIGHQVIQMGFGWQEPFLNQTPLIELPEDVSDEEVRMSAQPLLDLIPKPRPIRLLLPQRAAEARPIDPVKSLSPAETRLYEQIQNHPEVPSATLHYQGAGLSTKQAVQVKKSLLRKGLLKETPIESGRRGGTQLFLEVVAGKPGRYGNALHNYLRNKAEHWYRKQQCATEAEKTIHLDGQVFFVDLAVSWPDGTDEAVEIETEDNDRALHNIQKNIAAGFAVISVLTPNRKVRQAIEKRAKQEIPAKDRQGVRFPSISFYEQQLD